MTNGARPTCARFALLVGLALSFVASSSRAQAPVPTGSSPSMIGGQVVGAGRLVVGASTGFPDTQFRAIWGVGRRVDVGLSAGLTYASSAFGGLLQKWGAELQVPLRFNVRTAPRLAIAVRAVPYVRVGQFAPAYGAGSVLGARFGIALREMFTFVVGIETRAGYGSFGPASACATRTCLTGNRHTFFDGASYVVLGLETYFDDKWHFFIEADVGAFYTSTSRAHGSLYNSIAGFGRRLH